MLWPTEQVDAIVAAINAAREGVPTVLCVLGEAGMGKTSLLGEIVRRASGFNVMAGDGRESAYREPLTLLRQLGVTAADEPAGYALGATQRLRDRVDELSPTGPVLMVVDDLQWVDQESLESLYWLAHRARGDRLLLAVGSRPEDSASSDAWRRLVRSTSRGASLWLAGITLEQASAMATAADPTADEDSVRRLWDHTLHSPFHLASLLEQYAFSDLVAMRELPAPAAYARRIEARLATLAPDATALAYASAVLGYRWQPLPVLAAVGEVDQPSQAQEILVQRGLLVARTPDTAAPLRSAHALVRAAIYQSIPYSQRRTLHLSAAEHAGTLMESLEHRVAAADHYDEALARELDDAAATSHDEGEFGQAAQLLRWSSGLTADAGARNRRWLDGVVDLILARDLASVREQLPAVISAPNRARRSLIQGLMAGVEKRWLDAWAAYTSVNDDQLDREDSLTRYRLLVMTAWSMICAGRDLEALSSLLARAAAEAQRDHAFVGNELFALGMLGLRRGDQAALTDTLTSLSAQPMETPTRLTYKLAWRGSILAFWGESERAQADLLEVTTRIRSGVGDNGDGIYNGLLAFAYWQAGAWKAADLQLRIAMDHAVGQPHPMLRAIEPMLLTARGDLAQADKKLAETADVLAVMPWREPVHLYVISYIGRLHAGGDAAEQRLGLDHLRTLFGDAVLNVPGFTGALWLVHLAVAALWSGELDHAHRLIDEADRQPYPPRWRPWMLSWLRGLAAEAADELAQALTHLDAAVDTFSDDLPLYRAHVLTDQARVLHLQRDPATERSRDAADRLYRVLGAVPYLVRSQLPGAPPPAMDVLSELSDRERDVATLLISGLSYAQIARDLFVTRATVGFHTGRIYAKTGVSSRAQLIDLVRGSPA